MSNIVILYRQPDKKVGYGEVIDHRENAVTYVGKPGRLADIRQPAGKIAVDLDALRAADVPPALHEALAACDVLIARSEFDLLLAAELRELYNIPGDVGIDVLPIRDKFIMRRRARAAGILQPDFWSVPQFLLGGEQPGEFVLKPKRDASSNGIVAGGYAQIARRAAELADHSGWLVEAYVTGDVFHVDGFIADSQVKVAQLSQYINTCLSFSSGTPLGSVQIPTDGWVERYVAQIAACLGYRNGSFHMEFIWDGSSEPRFLEFGGRVGGASVAESFQLRTGVHLHACDLKNQLGYPIEWDARAASPDFFGWFVFPFGAKISKRLGSLDDLSRHIHWYSKSDAPAAPVGNSYHHDNSPLAGIVRDREDCARVIREIMERAADDAVR